MSGSLGGSTIHSHRHHHGVFLRITTDWSFPIKMSF